MSGGTPRRPERASSLFDQALDLELSFRGTRKCGAQMKQRDLVGRAPFEWRLDQRECGTVQHAVDQKEIFETIGVKGLDSSPLLNSHSNVLPARLFGANRAPGIFGMGLTYVASELSSQRNKAVVLRAEVESTLNFLVPDCGTFTTGARA